MWNSVLAARARAYDSAVLTVVESSGYPFSVRCRARFDDSTETIAILEAPRVAASWRGSASLMLHRHNSVLEDFHELSIKGELQESGGTLILKPSEFLTGTGRPDTDEMPHAGKPLDLLRFMRLGRRKAREYLAKRGQPWPPIQFKELVRAAKDLDAKSEHSKV